MSNFWTTLYNTIFPKVETGIDNIVQPQTMNDSSASEEERFTPQSTDSTNTVGLDIDEYDSTSKNLQDVSNLLDSNTALRMDSTWNDKDIFQIPSAFSISEKTTSSCYIELKPVQNQLTLKKMIVEDNIKIATPQIPTPASEILPEEPTVSADTREEVDSSSNSYYWQVRYTQQTLEENNIRLNHCRCNKNVLLQGGVLLIILVCISFITVYL